MLGLHKKSSFRLFVVLIRGSLPMFVLLHQLRGDGSFTEGGHHFVQHDDLYFKCEAAFVVS